jgi:maltose O-acetyltransferase
MIRHLCNLILTTLPPSRLFRFRNFLLQLSGIDIHSSARYCGRSWIYGRGKLHIGAGTWFSPGVIVHTHINADIYIGDCCDIGPAVEFITGGHCVGTSSRRAGLGTAKSIVINDGCWIGAGSRILGGVNVGSGVVVAAGSVVIKDVPANVLVAGVPAVVKKNLI